jgi:hypothetical protein
MAGSYKTLTPQDQTTTKTLLHESVPITGSIVSGTYSDNNIRNYGHGMFQSVYDYPFLSSSANHIFDITCGYASGSALSGTLSSQNSKKIRIYNQMAQVLMGYDATGSIQLFDQDGNLAAGGTKLKECYFINFARLLYKDEIKKGSLRMTMFQKGPGTPGDATSAVVLGDYGAANDFRVNSPSGEYGLILTSSTADTHTAVGLVYYQAGIAVLTASFFTGSVADGFNSEQGNFYNDGTNSGSVDFILSASTIQINANALRNRVKNISFNNTTELNSKIYFCRVDHNEFNYSANPTYTSGSKIVVKSRATDSPVAYATTVGLYAPDNALMAVAKLSEPMKVSPQEGGQTIRVRLDY